MKRFLIILLPVIIAVSCTVTTYPKMTQSGFYPEMYSNNPLTVLIMPVINRTNSTIGEDFVTSANAVMLAERGYYVMPASIIHNYIKQDSLDCLPDIDPGPCQIFHDRFGVDALLFVAVKNWQKDFSQNSLYEEFEYSLVSSLTGKELWFYDILVAKNNDVSPPESDNNGSFCVNLGCMFAAFFASTIATALTSYKLTADQASQMALQNLPAGKYQSRYMLDSLDQVKVNTIWKTQNFGNRVPAE